MKYVSLHHHSTYSYMDGYALPEDHVARAADLGMRAMALTEHGNVSSHVKLEQSALKHGIKPIFGLEAYTAPADMRETKNQRKWHQTILAMDAAGLQNLYKMVTQSWSAEDNYRWPTVTGTNMREYNEGLIVLSGCLSSKLATDLLGRDGKNPVLGDERTAEQTLLRYKRLLGDRYYLEVQQFPELERARQLNEKYEEWSRKHDVPLVATADCHYPMPDDNEYQKILHAAGRNTGTVSAAEASWEYDIRLTLPTSDKVIFDRLRASGLSAAGASAAIENTGVIADRCNVELPKMDRLRFPLPEGFRDSLEYMRFMLNQGWKYRGCDKLPKATQREWMARAKYELGMIVDKDFVDYFLDIADVISYVKDANVPVGPARGSAAASIVCWLLRITEVNPMLYPLMFFERFIDPNRHDLPDIDTDFDDELGDLARQRQIQKYGVNRVGNIGTFTRYRGKNSIDDAARVYEIPKFKAEEVKDFLVERSGGDARFDASIEDTKEMFPQVAKVFEEYPKLNMAIGLEGNLKGFGVHAAGIVVGADDLTKYVATYGKDNVGKNKNSVQVLSVDKYDGEHLGLLKLDALKLSTMGLIRRALEMIDMPLKALYDIPMDDQPVMDAFNVADVIGIFQFEGRTMRMTTQELKPETFMDLAAINALSRPGPLHSGSTGEYIAIRHGRQDRVDLHPIVAKICESTEGQIIYQEQILQITRDIGKFPWTHASAIRKIISSKKGESAFNAMWDDFRRGAESVGVAEPVAREIWKRMATAGTYAFNVAHCVSYSILGVWLMWLKVHHPIEFYTASLIKASTDEKRIALMRDMQDERYGRHYEALPPDLNESGVTWTATKNGVRAGFSQIPGIGEKTAQLIVDHRELIGGFQSWDELLQVKSIGPKSLEKIMDFATKEDPFGILYIKNNVAAIRQSVKKGELGDCLMPDTTSEQVPYEAVRSEHVICGLVKQRNLQDLFENFRSRTGEDLDPKTVDKPHLKDYMTVYLEDEAGMLTVKVDRYMYPKVKDMLWSAKIGKDFIVAKCTKAPFHGRSLKLRSLWVVEPDE